MDPNQQQNQANIPPAGGQQQPVYPTEAMPQAMPAQGIPRQAPPPQPTVNPNSTQNSLLVAEVRDGIAIMNDGTYRAMILTKSINFDLMSPQEREGVEYSYQSFINSLYFPIQIFVRSRKIDIRPYMDRLQKLRNEQDNMLLGLLMEDYIGYINFLAQETNIMNKQFYIIVPFFPLGDEISIGAKGTIKSGQGIVKGFFSRNKLKTVTVNEKDLETAKTELKNRVQSVMNGLIQMNLQAVPLDTQEIIELFYDAYNPDTATRQQLGAMDDLTTPIVSKGQGDSPRMERGF